MKSEYEAAAKWWSNTLRSKPKHDNGEPMHNAMFAVLVQGIPLVPEKVADDLRGRIVKFKTLPIGVEAVQWRGDIVSSAEIGKLGCEVHLTPHSDVIVIESVSDLYRVELWDWVVKKNDDIFCVNPDSFSRDYEAVS